MKSKYVKHKLWPKLALRFMWADDWFISKGGRLFYWQWSLWELDKYYDQHFRIEVVFNWWRIPYKVRFTFPKPMMRCETPRFNYK